MRKFEMLILIGLVLGLLEWSIYNDVRAFQGLPGDNDCRIYTEEASEQALEELNEQQALYIKFRSRQISENVPQSYIDQTQAIISDYERAIELTQSALNNEISQIDWQKALAPLQLSPSCTAGDTSTTQNEATGQKLIGFLMVLIVVGGIVIAIIYRKRAANNSSR